MSTADKILKPNAYSRSIKAFVLVFLAAASMSAVALENDVNITPATEELGIKATEELGIKATEELGVETAPFQLPGHKSEYFDFSAKARHARHTLSTECVVAMLACGLEGVGTAGVCIGNLVSEGALSWWCGYGWGATTLTCATLQSACPKAADNINSHEVSFGATAGGSRLTGAFGLQCNNPAFATGITGGYTRRNGRDVISAFRVNCSDGVNKSLGSPSTSQVKTLSCPNGQLLNAISVGYTADDVELLKIECHRPSDLNKSVVNGYIGVSSGAYTAKSICGDHSSIGFIVNYNEVSGRRYVSSLQNQCR